MRSIFVTLFMLGMGLLAFQGSEASAQGQCTINGNPHGIVIRHQCATPMAIYPQHHYCASFDNQGDQLCRAWNQLKVAQYGRDTLPLIIPHRGLWGPTRQINTARHRVELVNPTDPGPPENTISSLIAGLHAGFYIQEVDVMRVGMAGSNGSYDKDVNSSDLVLGHYFNRFAFGYDDELPAQVLSIEEITQRNMRDRDQAKTNGEFERVPSLREALQWAEAHESILLIDPKAPRGARADEYQIIMAKTLQIALEVDALDNIALKAVSSREETINGIDQQLRRDGLSWAQFEGKVLFIPITAKSPGKSLSDIQDFMRDWYSRDVALFETSTFTPEYIGAQEFRTLAANECIPLDWGPSYRDYPNWRGSSQNCNSASYFHGLINFARRMDESFTRAGLWSVDPMNTRGTLGALYNSKFIGNTADDRRANPLVKFDFFDGSSAVITTDRPLEYLLMTGQSDQLSR